MFGRGFPEAWQTSVVLPPSMMGEVNGYLAISGRSLKQKNIHVQYLDRYDLA